MRQKTFDPIVLEILWRRLISIVDEADASVYRTSFSSLIRDGHDYTNAFFDTHGRELCQGTMVTPGLLGALTIGIKQILAMFPIESYKPGDVLIGNDPWLFAGHLNDICVISPIFFNGRLIAFTACIFHHTDVGGRLGVENHEVFEEGLSIPIVKLYEAGVANEAVLTMIRRNVRMPENVVGDIRSQIAANYVCSQGIIEMMEETGLGTLDALADAIIARTEGSMRSAIESIPDGVYTANSLIEGAHGKADITIKAVVKVSGSNIAVDFDGTGPQVDWAVNSVYNFTYAYTAFTIKTVTDPDIPNNEGSVLPLEVKAPEGSALNCRFPAAVAHRTHTGHLVTDLIYRALAPAIPARILAASGSAPGVATRVYGFRHNGDRFLSMTLRGGGMGAAHNADGHFCAQFPANVANTPCEIFESDTPLMVEKKEIITDSGGAGRTRGGLGQEVVFRIPDDQYAPIPPVVIPSIMGRLKYPAEGLFGGKAGAKGRYQINGVARDWGGRDFCYPGDAIRFCQPGGGGFGNPLERPPDIVERDVRNGYVSVELAAEEYGVIIDLRTKKVDMGATQRLRDRLIVAPGEKNHEDRSE